MKDWQALEECKECKMKTIEVDTKRELDSVDSKEKWTTLSYHEHAPERGSTKLVSRARASLVRRTGAFLVELNEFFSWYTY